MICIHFFPIFCLSMQANISDRLPLLSPQSQSIFSVPPTPSECCRWFNGHAEMIVKCFTILNSSCAKFFAFCRNVWLSSSGCNGEGGVAPSRGGRSFQNSPPNSLSSASASPTSRAVRAHTETFLFCRLISPPPPLFYPPLLLSTVMRLSKRDTKKKTP